jgi:hypothetical protein
MTTDPAWWIVYGQTSVPPGSILQSLSPEVNGLLGEVGSLPYVVPALSQLNLECWGISAPDVGGTVALIPFIGPVTSNVLKRLPSAVAKAGVGIIQGNFILPAGTLLNFEIQNSQSVASIFSWYASGTVTVVGGP